MLPGMNGPDLVRRLGVEIPHLFVSGYTADFVDLTDGALLFEKPFSASDPRRYGQDADGRLGPTAPRAASPAALGHHRRVSCRRSARSSSASSHRASPARIPSLRPLPRLAAGLRSPGDRTYRARCGACSRRIRSDPG
ncbi:MAG TPA: hypothetical protein EYQ27_11265 [Gemmatimonadetes bacterium]|nr:hypothetical protein [Gemmatimonadota bacterium]